MSEFATYYLKNILGQLGWPRRRGLFRSEAVVDTLIADMTINQMIDWSAALGACYPRQALQAIASMYRETDWDGESAPQIIKFINGIKDKWDTQSIKAPHEIVTPFKLSKHFGKLIKTKFINDIRMRAELEQLCLYGLLWGLANPDRFKTWYESYEKSSREQLPIAKEAGLAVDSIPTLSEYLKECEEMLRAYEREVGPLSDIPSRLLAEARALGREI